VAGPAAYLRSSRGVAQRARSQGGIDAIEDGVEAAVERLLSHAHAYIELVPYVGNGRVLHGADEIRAFFREQAASGTDLTVWPTSFEERGDDVIVNGSLRVTRPSGGFAESQHVHLRYPTRHRRRWRSTNLLERSLAEVKRRTKVIGRFPGETSCLTLVWAVLDLYITHAKNGVRFSQLDRQCLKRIRYEGSEQPIPEEVSAA
jgi:mutator family transposase